MKIGEVSQLSGVSARMLRHYDDLGLVVPSARSSAGYREYSPADLRRLFQVESLRSLGLSLKEIGALDDDDSTPSLLVGELLTRTRARIEREQELLRRLERVDDAGTEDWETVLDVVVLLRELASGLPGRRQRAALTADIDTVPPGAVVDALVAENEQNVIGALRWVLVRIGDDAVPALVQALDSDDPLVRNRLLETLADLPGEPSTAALYRLIADPDPRVRTRAAIALSDRSRDDRSRDDHLFTVLIDAVCTGINDVEAAESLRAFDAERTVSVLRGRTSGAEPDVRLRIAQALGEIEPSAAGELLTELSTDEDEATARTARRLLH